MCFGAVEDRANVGETSYHALGQRRTSRAELAEARASELRAAIAANSNAKEERDRMRASTGFNQLENSCRKVTGTLDGIEDGPTARCTGSKLVLAETRAKELAEAMRQQQVKLLFCLSSLLMWLFTPVQRGDQTICYNMEGHHHCRRRNGMPGGVCRNHILCSLHLQTPWSKILVPCPQESLEVGTQVCCLVTRYMDAVDWSTSANTQGVQGKNHQTVKWRLLCLCQDTEEALPGLLVNSRRLLALHCQQDAQSTGLQQLKLLQWICQDKDLK